jgi:phosphomannomutase
LHEGIVIRLVIESIGRPEESVRSKLRVREGYRAEGGFLRPEETSRVKELMAEQPPSWLQSPDTVKVVYEFEDVCWVRSSGTEVEGARTVRVDEESSKAWSVGIETLSKAP